MYVKLSAICCWHGENAYEAHTFVFAPGIETQNVVAVEAFCCIDGATSSKRITEIKNMVVCERGTSGAELMASIMW